MTYDSLDLLFLCSDDIIRSLEQNGRLLYKLAICSHDFIRSYENVRS